MWNKTIFEAISYEQFNMTDHILCKIFNPYFEHAQPLGTKP